MTHNEGGVTSIAQQAQAFMSSRRSLTLATVGDSGEPEASYAPFLHRRGEGLYVYVSDLSKHTHNLRTRKCASALLIADERDSEEIFARLRLTLSCIAVEMARDDARWDAVMDAFGERFGDVMSLLRPLTDFHLFALQPQGGVFVRGFAQAYRFVGEELDDLVHIGGPGRQ